jgi:2-(1,2-epoxy-1,2-dihydrophenyl)acetyl-CoA isomerase
MSDLGRVTIDRDGPVAILTLDRPNRKNALAGTMREELSSHLEVVASDPQIGAIVVRGAGAAFCAGADVEVLSELQNAPDGADRLAAWLDVASTVIWRLCCDVRQPTLAAVRGPAVGAGLGIALACDFRLGGDDAVLGTGFAAIGLSADWGVSFTLPLRVGSARAMDLVLGSRRLGAAEAHAAGLLDAVVPSASHEDAWRERARRWADVPRGAREALVRALRRVDEGALRAALIRERDEQLTRFRSPEARAKVADFLAKRGTQRSG